MKKDIKLGGTAMFVQEGVLSKVVVFILLILSCINVNAEDSYTCVDDGMVMCTPEHSGFWTISGTTASYDFGDGIIAKVTTTNSISFSAGTFNAAGTGFWSDTVEGQLSLENRYEWGATMTINFEDHLGNPVNVDNPILHFDQIGGSDGVTQNSAEVVLQGGLTWTSLGGTNDFDTTTTTVKDVGAGTPEGGTYTADSSLNDMDGSAAGSLQIDTTVSTFTVQFNLVGPAGLGRDRIGLILEVCTDKDSDNDGIPDTSDICAGFDDTADNDNDGVPDGCDLDDDNDGILDTDEGKCTPIQSGTWNTTGTTASYDYGDGVIARATIASTDTFSTGSFNAAGTGFWSESLEGDASLQNRYVWGTTLTINFEDSSGNPVLVNNPVIHIDRLGGVSAVQNSAEVTLQGGLTWVELAGTQDFRSRNITVRDGGVGTVSSGSTESTLDDDGASAGSLQINQRVSSFTLEFLQSGTTGVADAFEIILFACNDLDTDDDGIADYLDLDSDNDGIYDVVEVGGDDLNADGRHDDDDNNVNNTLTNGVPSTAGSGAGITPTETTAGIPDFINLDSDGDGCSDANEAYNSSTADGGDTGVFGVDPAIVDPITGIVTAATYTTPADSDTNLISDYQQSGGPDDDGDGTPNGCDAVFNDVDNDGVGDFVDLDNDNDGILDSVECGALTKIALNWTTLGLNPPTVASASGQTITDIGTTLGIPELVGLDITVKYTYDGDGTEIYEANGLDVTGAAAPNSGIFFYTQNGTLSFTLSKPYQLSIENGSGRFFQGESVNYTPAFQGTIITNLIPVGPTGVTPGDLILTDDSAYNPSFSPFVDSTGRPAWQSHGPITNVNYILNGGNGESGAFHLFYYTANCDTDGDNVTNNLDLDSDNDGIYDVVEAGGADTNNDGRHNDNDNNVDNTATNGVPSAAAGGTGITPTVTTAGTPDYKNLDSDNDGCSDANEAYDDATADGGDGGQFGTTDPATVDGNGLVTETGVNYSLGTSAAVTNAALNVCLPKVSIDDVTVDEGDNAVFTVSLSTTSIEDITVTFTVDDATAVVTDDYTVPATLTVTIPAGDSSASITVATVEDTTNEPQETFEVNITNAETDTTNAAVIVDDAQGIGTIDDDDAVPTVSIDSVTVDEGDNAVFTVSLTNPSSEDITVTFTVDDATAVVTDDYTVPATLTVTIPAGDSSASITVATVEDTTNEPQETFEVNITGAETDTTNTALTVTTSQGIGTIDDDDAVPTVSIDSVTVDEGDNAVFTVSLTNPSSEDITVTFTVDDATAVVTDDYTVPATLTVTIPAGDSSASITVATVEDTTNEPQETFEVNITNAETDTTNTGLTVTTPQGIGTIDDDDAVPTVSIDSVTVDEGDNAVFTVSLTNPSSEDITVTFTVDDATAVVTDDYTVPATLTVTIPAGDSSASITVATVEDTTNEPQETFEVNITGAETDTTNTALTVTTPQGIGTIDDDDPVPTVSIDSVTVDEGDNAVFTVSLTNPSSEDITVTFTVDDATAVVTDDYTVPATLTVTIPAGDSSASITVATVEDTTNEPQETFEVNITGAETDTTNTALTVTTSQGIGTINDDDAVPTVSIDSVTVDEGDNAVFTVSLTNPSSEDITVTFTVDDATAVVTDDYTVPATLTVTIPAGDSSASITVATVEDTTNEPQETFEVNITGAETDTTNTALTVTTPQGIGTIDDDDPVPTVSIDSVTVDEGDNAVFTVSLTNPSSEDITVTFTVDDATAVVTDDYTVPATLTVTIPAGDSSASITVATVEDTTNEPQETFEVNITNAETDTTNTGLTVTTPQGIGTIDDDDAVPTVSIDSVTVDEGDNAVFTVSLTNPSSEDITVTFTVDDATAVVTDDYTVPATLTVTIPAGDSSASITVATVEDTTNEPQETFEVNITGAETDTTNTALTVTTSQGIGTIDDDDPVPTVSIDSVTVDEGDNAVFTVSLTNPSSEDITVTFTVDDATAVVTDDYTVPATLTVTIPAGDSSASITVATVEDTTNEPQETFEVNITGAETDTTNTALTVTTPQGIGTINDDDAVPTVSIDSVTVDEGDNAVFTVSLTNPSSEDITVTFTVDDATAVVTDDYTVPATLTVTIPAGDSSASITVATVEDTTNEPQETFEVNITGAETDTTNTALTVTTPQGIGTIDDDDPVPTVSIDSVTVDEGDNAVFTVSLTNPSSEDITVTFTVDDATAVVTDDYTVPATLTVTIPAGDSSASITVATVEDTTNEPQETFEVNITGAETDTTNTGLTVTTPQGIGTIDDDDPVPTVSIDSVTVDEGDNAVFTVSLTNPSSEDITVTFTVDDATAVVTDDYTVPATLTVTIPAGDSSASITVATVEDTTNEPQETFEVNITGAETDTTNTALTVTTPQGIGTINDDDPVPTVSIDSVTVDEGDNAVFTVSLTNPSSEDITVTFTVDDATAVVTDDYTVPATLTVTIPAGDSSASITVATVEDTTNEPQETFEVNITGAETDTTNTALTVTTPQGIGTINDDDPVPTVSIDSVTVDEGDNAVFTVSLTNPSSEDITVTFTVDDATAVVTDDYTVPATLTVTIPAGDSSASITVATVEDTTNEPQETFEVNITNAETDTTNTTLTVTTDQGIGTINDDDPVPTVSIDSVTVDEGDNAVFTVSLTNPSSEDITVTFTVDDATAVVTDDYTVPATLTVTIPAGDSSASITVATVEDTTNEPQETFEVNITGAETDTTNTALTVTTSQGIGTIDDDDAVPTVSIDSVTVDEGDNAVFTVSLTNPSSEDITVTFTVDDATAVVTDDYTVPATLTVTIPAGDSSASITVATVEDTTNEPQETFEVNITGAETDTTNTALTVTTSQGIGTINDDDPVPTVSIDSVTVDEGDNAVFTVSLTNPSSEDITVTFTVDDATAVVTDDYTVPATLTVTIPAGDSSASITVATVEDTTNEPQETFEVNITNAETDTTNTTLTVTTDQGIGTINDDDPVPTVSIDSVTVDEGDNAVFTVSLTNPSSEDITVTFTVDDATAVVTDDYTVPATLTVTIPAGDSSASITVATVEDLIHEATETFEVNITNAETDTTNTGLTVTTPQGIGTIEDNDPANPSMQLIKTVSASGNLLDEVIEYDMEITNTGNTILENVEVIDANADTGSITYPGGLSNIPTMMPGTSVVVTAIHTITQDDIDLGYVENSASTIADSPSGIKGDVNDVSDAGDDTIETPNGDGSTDNDPTNDPTVTLIETNPNLALTKTGVYVDVNNDGLPNVGDEIHYTFTIENTGNVDITDIIIEDPLLGIEVNGGSIDLEIGEIDTNNFTATYVLTREDVLLGSVSNQATAMGLDPKGDDVMDLSDDPTNTTDVDIDDDGDAEDETITIIEMDDEIVIYSGISPNGDNINDEFLIVGLDKFPKNTLSIFNRWGVKIFEQDGYMQDQSRLFRGISSGRTTVKESDELPVGTYYYVLEYENGIGVEKSKAGYIYINR